MACRRTFTFSEAAGGETPLDDAVYVAATDKIYGMLGPHIIKFNATTGAKESINRIFSPAYGTCRICYHAPLNTLYVTLWNSPINQHFDPPVSWAHRGIYPVNPVSLIVGAALNVTWSWFDDETWGSGPRAIMSAGGTYLYFASGYANTNSPVTLWRVNPLNVADRAQAIDASSGGASGFNQHATDGVSIFVASPSSARIYKYNLSLGGPEPCNIPGPYQFIDNPVAVEYSPVGGGAVYVVCGTTNMFKVTGFTPDVISAIDISTVAPATATRRPVRIRYRSSDQKLYLPCQNNNAILVWNPATDNPGDADWKTGFDSPIDVVFTPTKAWAVQNGIVGLKEIT